MPDKPASKIVRCTTANMYYDISVMKEAMKINPPQADYYPEYLNAA
jgi:hypothetical protein